MRHFKILATSISAAAMLAACGGGGNTTATITGLAATGAALTNANVNAKCSSGPAVAGKTGTDGTFALGLTSGQAVPCLVQVSNGTVTLHGFATSAGRINVTPLTDLVISKALGSSAAAAFAAFDASRGNTIVAGLVDAKSFVKAEVLALAAGTPSGDLLTGVFKVGDADDVVLDNLKAALATAGKTLDDLRAAAIAGGSLKSARGSLVDPAAVVTTLTIAQIDDGTAASGLQALTGKAKCDVKVVALNYNTIGVQVGEKTNASGVMLVPAGTCTKAAGLIAYAKGTDVQKLRTLANPADGETFLLAAMYAAQGYAVVATDYLGFARSTYAYHPYLHADSEATSVIDSIRAARNAAPIVGGSLSGKVMLTGYSQGGHSSMAAHRAIERDISTEINVVAGAHLAGPYNLSGSFKLTNAIAGYQFFVPYLVTAWQKVYGDVYTDVNAVFKAPYASTIEALLPSATLNYTTLISTGALPYGPSPNQARDALFQSVFLTDVQTNNSGTLFLTGKKNDLLGWNPKSKVLLCGGAGDPTVPPAIHQVVMKADFDSRTLANVTSVDVDSSVLAAYGPGTPSYVDAAKYYGNYHGTYEPPFCHAQAKAVFDSVN
jgi:pimeloyl-ACP methyl ester carboxylesterase